MKRHCQLRGFILTLGLLFLGAGCASPYLKGVTPQGKRAYLGPIAIQSTEAYKAFLRSARTEVDKQNYLFNRLRLAQDLQFYHDDRWYNALQSYRGGMWLMRNRYKKGQDTREFIKKYVARSEDTGKLHLVRYPDGSIQIGYYVLLNELDLLEDTARKEMPA